jgi:hypothetical protein
MLDGAGLKDMYQRGFVVAVGNCHGSQVYEKQGAESCKEIEGKRKIMSTGGNDW